MKKLLIAVLSLSLGFGASFAWGEEKSEETLQKKAATILTKIKRKAKEDVFSTLTIENDMFSSGRDENYTSGVRATWYNIGGSSENLQTFIETFVPSYKFNETTSTYYTVGQNIYTPRDISLSVLQPEDRPWAGLLYGTMGLNTITKNHVDDIALTLGVVGPAALGKETQTLVHEARGISSPQGWEHQLKNEPGFVLSMRRRWPTQFEQDIGSSYFSAGPSVNFSLGNIYTHLGAGLNWRLTPEGSVWQDAPITVDPNMPGSGIFLTEDNKLGWMLFGGIEGRLVGRNIFLDGNSFRHSHSVRKKSFVLDARVGISFSFFDKARISYTVVHRTKEFY